MKLDSKEDQPAQADDNAEKQIVEEAKDDFVIVDDAYLDGVAQEVPNLNKQSDFTRVNPLTASTDFKHFNPMYATFLIGPQFFPRGSPTKGAPTAGENAQQE